MATITTLNDGITGASFRGQVNTNFDNLNTDKAELSGATFTGDILVPDEAYGAGWNGSLEVPTKNAVYDKIETMGGGGATTFLGLTDTPSSYTGQTGKFPKVNAGETALEFVTLAGGGDALTSNPLSQFASTTSAQLAGVISDETGSGALVFATSPTLVTPVLGVATATSINGATITSGTLNGSVTGTNTGDQTSIVGLTGTMAQFDTAVTDGDIVYQSQALGTPASGTLTNCTGLPLSGVVDSTSEALGVGSIELGHATDTTITRVSAGVIAVEGVNVVTTALTGSTTQAGIAEASIASEVNTGTDANRYVSPDSLAGSNLGIRYVACSLNGTTALTTSDKAYFRIPSAFTGMNLVSVSATVGTGASGSSSSGVPTFTVKNVTDGNQMLSTSLTVDASEYTSATAATPAVINASFDDVVTDDLIEVACTVAGTGVTYATILVGFQLP